MVLPTVSVLPYQIWMVPPDSGRVAGPILVGTANTWSSSRARYWMMLSVRGGDGPDLDGTAGLVVDYYTLVFA